MPAPKRAERIDAYVLTHRHAHNANLKPQAQHRLTKHIVLRDELAKPREATEALRRRLTKAHRFANHEGFAEKQGNESPTCKKSIEIGALHLAAHARRGLADHHRAHHTGAFAKVRKQLVKIVALNPGIAVANQTPLVLRHLVRAHQIVDFWVGTNLAIADDELGVHRGKAGLQRFDDRYRRVIGIRDRKKNFEDRVFQSEVGEKIFLEPRISPLQRFEQGNRFLMGRNRLPGHRAQAFKREARAPQSQRDSEAPKEK